MAHMKTAVDTQAANITKATVHGLCFRLHLNLLPTMQRQLSLSS